MSCMTCHMHCLVYYYIVFSFIFSYQALGWIYCWLHQRKSLSWLEMTSSDITLKMISKYVLGKPKKKTLLLRQISSAFFVHDCFACASVSLKREWTVYYPYLNVCRCNYPVKFHVGSSLAVYKIPITVYILLFVVD